MYNQQSNQKLTIQNYECIQQDSPQMLPLSSRYKIEQFQLQTSQTLNIKSTRKRKSKHLKQRQTNLIKIKPVFKQQQQGEKSREYQKQLIKNSLQKSFDQVQLRQNNHKQHLNRLDQNKIVTYQVESPILYKFSDDDISNQAKEQVSQFKQYHIPQSSRRGFKQYQQQLQNEGIINLNNEKMRKKCRRKLRSKQGKMALNEKIVSFYQQYQKKQDEVINKLQQQNKQNQNQKHNNQSQIYDYEQQQQPNVRQDSQNNHQQQQDHKLPSSQQQQQQQDQQENYSKKDSHHHKKISNPQQYKPPSLVILKSNSFYTIINAQIPQGSFVNCVIKRKRSQSNKNSLLNIQTTVIYQMFLLQDKKFLMSCVKNRLLNLTSHFQFYRQRISVNEKYHKENLYAVLDSNFTGTQFVLKTVIKNDTFSQRSTAIDKSDILKVDQSTTVMAESLNTTKKSIGLFGCQNKIGNKNNQSLQNSIEIKQSCFISFKANFFGLGGQRQVKMLKKKNKKIQKTEKFSDIKQAFERGQFNKISELHNKKASYGKNGLELDLKRNAKMQSTKNIILQNQLSKQALIFGKIKQDIYTVSIGYPLSIVEGIAFGVANLDRKFFVN